jgi:hypothetical protein
MQERERVQDGNSAFGNVSHRGREGRIWEESEEEEPLKTEIG